MAKSYRVDVIGLDRCGDIATLALSRPGDFVFNAGQWLRLTLLTADGPATKTFTIASAPADDWLEITTRLSGSAFKLALSGLAGGRQAEIAGPGGRLRLPTDTDKVAFLAGGVGITPVRSMLRDALNAGRRFSDALIVYGNRDASCVSYAAELAAMSPSGVRVVDVYERPPQGWEGPRGFVTASIVSDAIDPADGRPFFITGPPVMIEAMVPVLDELGIPEDRRTIESFGPVGE